ncbi:serine carboxypeptidase II-3-like isoform X2 [Phoenix dactylifera]|uniref:Carboxypeptidase n=1 Tax=Phoenix dactylifera TaxID=42345 RepID=A0A8B8ZEU9_PHODC|nr:serine carboxypeptidase II-3-like isoform X2 [Phoenix dactylifera]
MMGRMFLCLLLCFLASIATGGARGGRRGPATRQGDALSKLYFDALMLKRAPAAANASSYATALFSDLSSKTYPQRGLKESDKIIKLPGQPEGVDFDQYGGYVTVDMEAGRALFYYFAEAASADPSSRPLVLWLNGGPGCSSFGIGAMEELGPFRVMSDGKTLFRNPYAWNRVANVLFLESPAGVGFSYSNTTSDYGNSGDSKTAKDAYVFLVNWMERFPEYKGRDFYIAGESYGGHYVPQLAHTILQHKKSKINLKGIMIGNGVINTETDGKGMFDYFWTHALISDEAIDVIHNYCNFSPNASSQPKQCLQAVDVAAESLGTINLYNIYAPLCTSPTITRSPKGYSIENFDPCTADYVSAYLNTAEVQMALHANVTRLNYTWSGCSQVLTQWTDSPFTVLPLIKESMAHDVQVLVYSGDVDGRVPVTSSRYSLNQLKLRVKTQWQPWFIKNEVGGYSVVYDGNLTFATVRGAGHEVPSYQALRALVLAKFFLDRKPLPS